MAGRAIGRGFEVRIAEAAIAPAGEEGAPAGFGQIGDQRRAIFFVDLRADRYLEHGVGAARAVAVLAHAAAAVPRLEVLLVAIVDERVEALDRLRDHVTALAAITAVRPAEFDELLAAERDTAVAAVAGADIDLRLIEEFH